MVVPQKGASKTRLFKTKLSQPWLNMDGNAVKIDGEVGVEILPCPRAAVFPALDNVWICQLHIGNCFMSDRQSSSSVVNEHWNL